MANNEEFKPLGIIDCPHCAFPSLSWNMVCIRCEGDLFPEEHTEKEDHADDDADRHRQVNE